MILSDKMYKFLKWFLILFVPAFLTLIIGLGQLWDFETELIVGTISLLATFLGAITKISDSNYKNDSELDNIQ